MTNSCAASNGVTASMLPNTIVWTLTDDGASEAMNRPDKQHCTGGKSAGNESTQRVGQAEHVSAGDAGDNRVRQGISDQGPALEHQVARQEGTNSTNQRAGPDGIDHVAILQRLQQQLDQ